MAYPTKLLNDGEHVVSTGTHPKALIAPASDLLIVTDESTEVRVLPSDIPRVGMDQLRVAEEPHELSTGARSDDGT